MYITFDETIFFVYALGWFLLHNGVWKKRPSYLIIVYVFIIKSEYKMYKALLDNLVVW